MNVVERLFALRSTYAFRVLYDSELAAIARIARVRVFAPGTTVVPRGGTVDRLYVVVEGALTTNDGAIAAAGDAGLPSVWGHRELLEGRPAAVTVRADRERGAQCVTISRPHFLTVAQESPEVLTRLGHPEDAGTAAGAAGESPDTEDSGEDHADPGRSEGDAR